MTNPNVPSNWPVEPTVPNTAPAGYVTPVAPNPTPVETPNTSAQIEARRSDFYELLLRQVLLALSGFFSPVTSAFNQLVSWANNIPLLGDIVNALAGVPGTLETLADWAVNLLDNFSPLNAFNLFGVLQPHSVAAIPGGAVAPTEQNLIAEGAFRDVITIVADQGWAYDPVEGHTIAGSAVVTADGEQNELVSNPIPVTADEVIAMSVWTKWSGLSYTGTNPISFGITGYQYDPLSKIYTELESVEVAAWATPATSSGWVQLTGNYTVPGLGMGAIPDVIRMRLRISQDLNSGNIWWDEASAIKSAHVPDVVVPGVGNILNNIVNGLENLAGDAWSHIDGFFALFGQNAATVGLNTRVNYLESLQTAGIQANDLFERVDGAGLGTDWDMTYSGGGGGFWAIPNGHDASWSEAGAATRIMFAKFVQPGATTSNTDTQKVVGVLGSKPEDEWGSQGRNVLIGRYSSDKLNGIFAYFGGSGRVSISKLISGVETEMGFVNLTTGGPSSGSSICLLCGTPSGTRFFQATINGQIVLEVSDSTSNVGASYRGWGHGVFAVGFATAVIWPPPFVMLGQASPGVLNSWSAIDN